MVVVIPSLVLNCCVVSGTRVYILSVVWLYGVYSVFRVPTISELP